MVILITALELDVVSLLEQINISPGTWYADPANAFLSIPVNKAHQIQFAFGWQKKQYTFTALPHRDLDCFFLPQGNTLVHDIDDKIWRLWQARIGESQYRPL